MANQFIPSKKNYEIVMERLIELIRSNNLKPGDKLDSIEKLSNDFGVSRSVVREALSGLKAMGVVSIQQGEGTFISNFKPTSFAIAPVTALLMKKEDIKELLEVREILEVGAVRLAAVNRTDEDLVQIENALSMMKENRIDEQSDYAFHYHVVLASKNNILVQMLQNISELMIETIRDTQKVILEIDSNMNELVKEHQLIFEAITQKQPDLAEKHMTNHLKNVKNSLAPFID